MDKLNTDKDVLQEAVKFFQNEIKQYEIAITGILRKEYREYLTKKIQYYQSAIDAIKELTKEG